MNTWGNWPLDDSLSRHFREPWIICSVGNPEEWRMQGFWATKWGYHGNLWENMWIHGRLPIHFLGDVPLLGGRTGWCFSRRTGAVQPQAGGRRSSKHGWNGGTPHLFGLWVIVCEHWVAKNERVCHQENANLWPMGPWAHGHIMCCFFFSWPWDSAAAAGKKVKAGAGGEGGLDDLQCEMIWVWYGHNWVPFNLVTVVKIRTTNIIWKKTVGLWRVQRCPELFSPSTCGETAGWSSWHLLPRLRKEQAACEAKMADWSPRYDQLVLRYAENPWNLFPEIFQPWSLHPGLQLPRLHPQLQGLARPVAGLVPLPQNLAVPMFIGIIGPSNQNNSCQTFNSFLPSGFWAKSSVFRPVGFRPQSSCLFPGCGQGGQSDHPHDPRWHLFVGRSAQVGRPTNEMPTWVAMPKDAEISIYLSIYYLIYLFTLFVYLFNLLIN